MNLNSINEYKYFLQILINIQIALQIKNEVFLDIKSVYSHMQAQHYIQFGQGFAIYKLKQAIRKLRDAINWARTHNIPSVSYCVRFYPNTKIYGNTLTKKDDVFKVDLNVKTLYPLDLQDQAYTIRNAKTNQLITFKDVISSPQFNLPNALAIMIASQIRFNTLDIEYDYLVTLTQPYDLYRFLYDNYKIPVYSNWVSNDKGNYTVTIKLKNQEEKKVEVKRKVDKMG